MSALSVSFGSTHPAKASEFWDASIDIPPRPSAVLVGFPFASLRVWSQNSGLSIHLTLLPDFWLSAALMPPVLLPSTAEHDSFVFSPATETVETSPT